MLTILKLSEGRDIKLIDYLKSNLTLKLFLLICVILLLTNLMICGIFALIMPQSFIEVQNEQFEDKISTLLEQAQSSNLIELDGDLENFAVKYQVYLAIHDSTHQLINDYGAKENAISFSHTFTTPLDEFSNNAYGTEIELKTPSIHQLKTRDQRYTLYIYGNQTHTVNEVLLVIQRVLPFIMILTVFISFLTALFLSKFITKPIKEINNATKEITKLSFSVHCDETRIDELGQLATNINCLSQELETAICSLKEELNKAHELEENQRLFFAAASHELKTPLTVLKAYLESLLYGFADELDKEVYLSNSLKKAYQMEKLTGEILTISNINALDTSLNLEYTKLDIFVQTLLEEFADVIELKQFEVVLHLTETSHFVDRQLFKKALHNIISNALFYSPDGEILTIELTSQHLVISNSGVTIQNHELVKIFDPFYRIDKSRNRQTGGSGLGLHFVKLILTLHHFSYHVTSHENHVNFMISFDTSS